MAPRLLSTDTKSGLLVLLGVAMPALGYGLGLGAAPMVAGLAISALVIALGLAGTATSGRGSLPVRAQAAYDRGLAVGLLAAGVIFGVAGEMLALLLFGAAAATTWLICVSTRYTPGPRSTPHTFL